MLAIKLGLIADIQYCDCENGFNYEKTKARFYRGSLTHLDNALHHFITNGCDKVLQLGDLIDGKCKAMDITDKALMLMSKRFDTDEFESFHVLGNHELYNLSRKEWCTSFLGDPLRKYVDNFDTGRTFYKVNLSRDICLIVLDCYDVSVLNERDHSATNVEPLKGEKILRAKNKNDNWNDQTGLTEPKYVAYNGAFGPRQLKWLTNELTQATLLDQVVILAGHIPLLSSATNLDCIVWNNDDLLHIIDQYDCVKAYFCGHDHNGSVLVTDRMIHITMPGVIESLPDNCAYGILEMTKDELHLSALPGYWNDIHYHF